MNTEILESIKNDFLEELEPLEIRQKDKSIMLKAEEYKYFAADMSMTENILEGNVPFFVLEALQELNRDYIFTDYSGLGVEIKKIRNIFDDKEISLADFKKKVQETKEYKERKEIAENGEPINFDKLPTVLKIFFRACR